MFTTTLQISPRNSLLAFSFLPVIMLIGFFAILPKGPLAASSGRYAEYEAIVDDEQQDDYNGNTETRPEHEELLSSSMHSASGRSFTSANSKGLKSSFQGFQANLRRARGLFFP